MCIMNSPKVSVIIPVYGVEKYIERCARSLFEQTLEDIEYIFVDDCTPDNSISILRKVLSEYPNREKQVKILHHDKNKGLAKARQTGLKIASGEYIAHCDSDDWVDKDLYKVLYNQAVNLKSDMIAFDCKFTDGVKTLKINSGGECTDTIECISSMMHRKTWWSLCNKLIRKDIYDRADIIYPVDNMGEDMCLTLQLLYYCKAISYKHDVFYYYYQNTNSIIQVQTEENCIAKFYQICRNVEKVQRFYSKKRINKGIKKGLRYLEYNAKFPLHPLMSNNKYRDLWRNSYKGCEWSVVFDKYAYLKERIRALLCIVGLYPLLHK